jgi:hypothetical protein
MVAIVETKPAHGRSAIVMLAMVLHAASAQAASPDAWDEFRQAMDRECRALVDEQMTEVAVRIDPFGTETYGVALVTGTQDGQAVERVCVMDKASRAAEIGAALPAREIPAAMPLDPADAAEIDMMREVAQETLAQIERAGEPLSEEAMDAAGAMMALGGPIDEDGVDMGPKSCTVYWYGFLDQGARRVGSHRCRLTDTSDGFLVEKLSGERLSARVTNADGAAIYAGRSFLEGHAQTSYDRDQPLNAENENFGNKVGIAAAQDQRLYLLTTQARGMQPPDPTFFELLVVEP